MHEEYPFSQETIPPKPWFKKWWVYLLAAFLLLVFIYVVYIAFLVYNEYHNLKTGIITETTELEIFLAGRKHFDPDNENLDYAGDPYLGSPQADLKIVEFADFQCPYCREVFSSIRKMAALYGDQVQFIIKDFPVNSLHPLAQEAAQAASCADQQGQYWSYHDQLFINQDNLTTEQDLINLAKQINLNISDFQTCLSNNQITSEINHDYQEGNNLGVRGTPTFFFNGVMVEGSLSEAQFVSLIEYFLNN